MTFLGKKVPDYLIKDLNRSQEYFEIVSNGQFSEEQIRTDKGIGKRSDPISGYTNPIYILMDRACASSCEFTVAAFEWHRFVKRVGENTQGTFHFSNAGIAVLPNSKIKVMIPSQYSEYYDYRFLERIGFTPDIQVSPGRDAYTITKDLISSH